MGTLGTYLVGIYRLALRQDNESSMTREVKNKS